MVCVGTKMKYTLNFEEISAGSLPFVGGKNANLGEMLRAGIRVPTGFATTTDSYLCFITRAGIKDEIFEILSDVSIDDEESLDETSAKIQALIGSAPIPDDIQDAIKEGYSCLCEKCCMETIPVAVRSSATAEDLPTASFAGQHETYLWVQGADQVIESIRRCWGSLYTPRAISYRVRNNCPHNKAHMSVGIQKMVNSRTAGVMFTLNPVNGDYSKIVIEGSWGLGESVVSGCVTPDRFVLDKVMFNILEKSIGDKSLEYTINSESKQILKRKIDPEKQRRQCLSDEEVILLAEVGKAIEKFFGYPQDIEWAFEKDTAPPENLFMLQTRPETIWSSKEAKPVTTKSSSYMNYMADRFSEGW